MTSMYDEVGMRDLAMAAGVVLSRHRDSGCEVCTPDGCRELAWAGPVVAAWEREWAAVVDAAAGSW
ncbi:hypothetical protein E0H26_23795 [Micromonospora zingiberis]|uniref:Uncharacterized protein n=1 Tax=Micromonospora zingiberis TaxID=2053011 RepID=A0A4R0G9L8_9ACTN|nr:hypothetical protein [Micromonospora zingiberis]TCB92682.1 hypothetical protein E0H26_23795 [Micromonospora zingiberis]